MIDIFETPNRTIDSGNNEFVSINNDFHSINNDSSLSDINTSSGNVLSEINIYNSKDSNDI